MKEELLKIIDEELEKIKPSIKDEYEPIEEEINELAKSQNEEAEFEKKKALLKELLKLKDGNFKDISEDAENIKEALDMISIDTLEKELEKAKKDI